MFSKSRLLLGVSIWIRLQLAESPAFQKMKDEGKQSKAPLTEAFGNWTNGKIAILALLVGVLYLPTATATVSVAGTPVKEDITLLGAPGTAEESHTGQFLTKLVEPAKPRGQARSARPRRRREAAGAR